MYCSLPFFLMYFAFFVAFSGNFFAMTEAVRVAVGHSVLVNFSAFLVGGLVCYLMERFPFGIPRKTAFLILVALAILMITLLEIRAEKGGRIYTDYPGVIICESVLWGAVMAVMLASNASFFGRVGSVLAKISYSLYLCHLPIIFFFAVHLRFGTAGMPHDPGIAFLLSVLVTIAVSILLYRAIEVPAFIVRDFVLKRRVAAQRLAT
jgi:peptidoglycan/LPS O-acetylase OafA/YrhL